MEGFILFFISTSPLSCFLPIYEQTVTRHAEKMKRQYVFIVNQGKGFLYKKMIIQYNPIFDSRNP